MVKIYNDGGLGGFLKFTSYKPDPAESFCQLKMTLFPHLFHSWPQQAGKTPAKNMSEVV